MFLAIAVGDEQSQDDMIARRIGTFAVNQPAFGGVLQAVPADGSRSLFACCFNIVRPDVGKGQFGPRQDIVIACQLGIPALWDRRLNIRISKRIFLREQPVRHAALHER